MEGMLHLWFRFVCYRVGGLSVRRDDGAVSRSEDLRKTLRTPVAHQHLEPLTVDERLDHASATLHTVRPLHQRANQWTLRSHQPRHRLLCYTSRYNIYLCSSFHRLPGDISSTGNGRRNPGSVQNGNYFGCCIFVHPADILAALKMGKIHG